MLLLSGKRRVYLAYTVLLLVYAIAGLYPFHFQWQPISIAGLHGKVSISNGARWTADQHLYFPTAGIAYTEEPPPWVGCAICASSLLVSLNVQAIDTDQVGPARIFTLSSDISHRNLTVGQDGADLSVRMRNLHTNRNGVPAYMISDVFADGEWHQVDVLIRPQGLKISVDGRVRVVDALPSPPLNGWDTGYRLAAGNELTGNRPWRGKIRKAVVATDADSVDYLAPGALSIPGNFSAVSDGRFNVIPFVHDEYSHFVVLDWVINFFGFVPLGWLVAMVRMPRSSLFIATIFSATVSAAIEISQLLLLETRTPSFDDFLLNTLGGAFGAWFAMHYHITIKKRSTETLFSGSVDGSK